MRVGVPKEVKDHEYRVGVTPAGAHALIQRGHEVVVETGAGARIGFADAAYQSVGAQIDRVAFLFQCPPNKGRHLGFIFNHENAHWERAGS